MTKFGHTNLFLVILLGIASSAEDTPATVEYIQAYNVKTLKSTLPLGWKHFCDAEIDEGVIAIFPGSSPSDSSIHLITTNNETISLPIKYVSKITEFGLDPARKTIIYVNAFHSDHIYNIRGNLQYMQEARKDYNIIVVDFAQDILQLYNAVKHNVFVEGYFISKLISSLAVNGVNQSDVTLIGHSVGANIAALGASLHSQEEGGKKVSTLIAIDPALMCQPEDMHVNANVCDQVVVIHGENDIFSMSEALGTLDIYPNGYGLKYQPGCTTKLCSHVYPFLLFLDAVTEKTSITAVKCESWAGFRRGKCDYSSVVSLDFDFGNATTGRYYCITQPSQPYGLEEEGLRFKKRPSKKTTPDTSEQS